MFWLGLRLLSLDGGSHSPKLVFEVWYFFGEGGDVGEIGFYFEVGYQLPDIVFELLSIVFFVVEVGLGEVASDLD